KVIWVLAVVTALMTAFYMFRLMSMTFFGAYHGPAWEAQRGLPAPADVKVAAAHGAPHSADAHAHPSTPLGAGGQAHKKDHEVAHGPAEPHPSTSLGAGAHGDA